jgi:uncharacterized protein
MLDKSIASITHQVGFKSFLPYLGITFGLAWGILGLFIGFPGSMTALFGTMTGQHPLFFLAVWAPAIAAFIIVLHQAGFRGLRRYLSRLLLWRTSPAWYAFLLIGIPLVFIGGSAWKGTLGAEPFPFASLQSLFVALGLAAIKGPIEEFGWRGLALPLLQRKFSSNLGCLASASLLAERDAAKRVVIFCVLCRMHCVKCHRHPII